MKEWIQINREKPQDYLQDRLYLSYLLNLSVHWEQTKY